ncbi:hypothetical protein CHS0354_037675 [Potamilus streckersoni]|uniref:ZMYM2-like/QRICH1 C-terminal domain-containing protein n=1 Tax=Potamilus streckersoni TaxID=2493646 RepID=A0AAE0T0C2_9BIVA|nr:hypothetical protein CHS0354_037675 [Potamilus streckersoni]
MERSFKPEFFTSLVEAIRRFCQDSVTFDHSVEISGYVCLEVDSLRKERYILSELIQSSGTVISESFCSKVFRTIRKPQASQASQTEPEEEDKRTSRNHGLPFCQDRSSSDQLTRLSSAEKIPTDHRIRNNVEWGQDDTAFRRDALHTTDLFSHPNRLEQHCSSQSLQREDRSQSAEKRDSKYTMQTSIKPSRLMTSNTLIPPNVERMQGVSFSRELLHGERKNLSVSDVVPVHPIGLYAHELISPAKRIKVQPEAVRQTESTRFQESFPLLDLGVVKVEKSGDEEEENLSESRNLSHSEDEMLRKRKLLHVNTAGTEKGSKIGSHLEEGKSPLGVVTSTRNDIVIMPADMGISVSGSDLSENSNPSCSSLMAIEKDANRSLNQSSNNEADVLDNDSDDIQCIDLSDDSDENEKSDVEAIASQAYSQSLYPISMYGMFNNSGDLDSENKHTVRKTRGHARFFQNFLFQAGEMRPFHTIPPEELDPLLGTFFASLKKENGEEYEPSYVRNIQCSLDRFLRSQGYGYSVTKDHQFQNSRHLLMCKQDILFHKGKGNTPMRRAPITEEDIEEMYKSEMLGTKTPDSLLNSLWLIFTINFGLKGNNIHYALKWGDVQLGALDDGREYLHYVGTALQRTKNPNPVVFAKPDNPERCPIHLYKVYASKRPADFCDPNDPFYLSISLGRTTDEQWYVRKQIGINKMANIVKKMAMGAGLPQEKRLANTSAHKFIVTEHSKPDDISTMSTSSSDT